MNPVLPRSPLIELVTKTGCHLCDDARTVLDEVTGALGLSWSERRLDEDPELAARYAEEIPVVLVDGVPRDFWTIDPVRLRAVLRAAVEPAAPPAT